MSDSAAGRLVIVSGPSGAGKSTVVQELIRRCPLPLKLSVSATTRPPRPGELHGREYLFLVDDEFSRLVANGEFLECKEVFGRGHWYGTLRRQVATGLEQGHWVILEIDVQGALAVMEHVDLDPLSVFIHSGSIERLEERLRGRGTETDEAIARRLEVAEAELAQMHHYDHQIINDEVGRSVDELCQYLQQTIPGRSDSECSKN